MLEAVVGSTASFLIQSRSPQAELVDHSCVRLAQQRNPGEKHKGGGVHVGGGRITLSVDHVNNEFFRACLWFEFDDIAATGRSPIADSRCVSKPVRIRAHHSMVITHADPNRHGRLPYLDHRLK